jgi:hypothetical protein
MAGRFPPRPPLILGCFPDLSHLPAGPVGSSQVQQGGKGLDLNRYEYPPSRPSASSTTEFPRTGSFKTLTLPSNIVDGFSRAAITEQKY